MSLTSEYLLTTSQADPWTQHGYSKWNAMDVRREWMRMMGMSEEDIAEVCIVDPPTDFDEELSQYNAMFQIEQRNDQ